MKLSAFFLNKYFLVALALFLAAAGWWAWSADAKKSSSQRYRLETLALGEVSQVVSANGTLNPVVLVSVGSQVSGSVRKLYVDYNAKVSAGQVLLELDDALYRAQMAQSSANVANAQASLELARANEARMRALFQQEYVSRQELDQSLQALKSAKAGLDLAHAQLDKDKTNLSFTVIRSPVSGTVVDRQVDVGQTVAASFQTPTLFKIAQDLSKMQIDSSFAEADVGVIRVGQPVKFRVDAFANRSFDGVVKVVRLNPTTTQNVVTYDVVVSVDNPEQILLPGMTAYVNILAAQKKDVLLLPNAALRFKPAADVSKAAKSEARPERPKVSSDKGGDKSGEKASDRAGARGLVHVLRGGEIKPVVVRTGITDNRVTEVIAGDIKVGDQVVVEDTLASPGPAGAARPPGRMF